MQIGKYKIRWHTKSRRSILDPVFSHNKYYDIYHIIIGKLSVTITNTKDPLYGVCACCGSDEVYEKHYLDEGWTVCDSCGSVEGGYEYISQEELEDR